MEGNGGHLAAEVLKRHGTNVVYTLSGGHIFSIYDGCVARDIRLLDVRHEQTAAFAAEGHAKLTADLGVAAVTAGPGVTNAVSALTSAHFNGAPVLALAGRAPQGRWGAGSLQEIDHLPIVESITKRATTIFEASDVAREVTDLIRIARTPHRGPVFCDLPLESAFTPADVAIPDPAEPKSLDPDPDAVAKAGALLGAAERPVLLAGTDVWFAQALEPLRTLAESVRIPVFANGMGRGCVPASHDLSFLRARSTAFRGADVVCVIGTPLDFRLGFGDFGDAKVIHVQDDASQLSGHANPDVAIAGDLPKTLEALRDEALKVVSPPDRDAWITTLAGEERSKRLEDAELLSSEAHPIHPARVYGVLGEVLDRDAVVICDGGDFVSFAGKYVDVQTPGAWLDPGPYGCLGTGLGYAIASRIVHPDRQVVLLLGDGAAGFGLMDVDTLVRHNLPVVMIVGNNGIWALEKHPMKALFGYDVAADLRQDTRYDAVVEALGGAGETVEKASELPEALKRAFKADAPYLLNVLTDPEVVYPRSANLA